MESAQMIFPNGGVGSIGGGEFVTTTKFVTGIFGVQIPYVTTEFVPNKISMGEIKRANDKVIDNIAYAPDQMSDMIVGDGSIMKSGFGMIGGPVAQSGGIMGVAQPAWGGPVKPKECPAGWIDNGLTCSEPLTWGGCGNDRDDGLMCWGSGGPYPKKMQGGSVMSKF
jgi:hypothetical protein